MKRTLTTAASRWFKTTHGVSIKNVQVLGYALDDNKEPIALVKWYKQRWFIGVGCLV